jgi:hypothetical protein
MKICPKIKTGYCFKKVKRRSIPTSNSIPKSYNLLLVNGTQGIKKSKLNDFKSKSNHASKCDLKSKSNLHLESNIKSNQNQIKIKSNQIKSNPFHSIPFHSIPFHSIPGLLYRFNKTNTNSQITARHLALIRFRFRRIVSYRIVSYRVCFYCSTKRC